MNPYRKATFACLRCRRVRRVLNIDATVFHTRATCCDEPMTFTNNVPAKDDDKGWKALEAVRESYLRFRYPRYHGLSPNFSVETAKYLRYRDSR